MKLVYREKEIEKWLFRNLRLVEPGLQPITTQADIRLNSGQFIRIDILAMDTNGREVLIEVKANKVTSPWVLKHMHRYMDYWIRPCRAILAAPDIKPEIRTLLENDPKLSFFHIGLGGRVYG